MVSGDSLAGAIAATVAYQDVFAFAPRVEEIHRFLIGREASLSEVQAELSKNDRLRGLLDEREGLWFFRGKDHLVPRRLRFGEHSTRLWPKARVMADAVAKSGLATCGMVTGSLAADNADEHADVDFLFVYPAERTYLSYAAVRILERLPALDGMCPNYALAEDRLEVRPQNLFTAWEIAKAVPMFGFETYAAFARANAWVRDFLPQALPILDAPIAPPPPPSTNWWDRLTKIPGIAKLEAFERVRKNAADERDVGVDMKRRAAERSMDRHAPTRSSHALCELAYRMSLFGLTDHPLYPALREQGQALEPEMNRWGERELPASARRETPHPRHNASKPL